MKMSTAIEKKTKAEPNYKKLYSDLLAKSKRDETTGCMIYTGNINFRNFTPRVLAYEANFGKFDKNTHSVAFCEHHAKHNYTHAKKDIIRCVEPSHLRLMSKQEVDRHEFFTRTFTQGDCVLSEFQYCNFKVPGYPKLKISPMQKMYMIHNNISRMEGGTSVIPKPIEICSSQSTQCINLEHITIETSSERKRKHIDDEITQKNSKERAGKIAKRDEFKSKTSAEQDVLIFETMQKIKDCAKKDKNGCWIRDLVYPGIVEVWQTSINVHEHMYRMHDKVRDNKYLCPCTFNGNKCVNPDHYSWQTMTAIMKTE